MAYAERTKVPIGQSKAEIAGRIAPKRVQMRRDCPWRQDHPDAVIVARPSKWGNPFKVGATGIPDAQTAVRLFANSLLPYRHQCEPIHGSKLLDYAISEITLSEIRKELAGNDLACWCPLDQPCHADVLLRIANPTKKR